MLLLFAFAVLATNPTSPSLTSLLRTAVVQEADACSLLTEAQVSAALEVKVGAGQHAVASNNKQCIWSDDPKHGVDHRRATLTFNPPAAFNVGKQASRPTAEPASGVGDEAYYEFFGTDAPALVVREGGTVFTVRILNGLKLKAIPTDVLKAKELELAKAAAAKA